MKQKIKCFLGFHEYVFDEGETYGDWHKCCKHCKARHPVKQNYKSWFGG